MTLHRRTLLTLTGATAAAAVGTTAGCLETAGLEAGGEIPAYATHLDADGGVGFAYVGRAALEALDDSDTEEEPDEWDDHEDAMIAYPMIGALAGFVVAGFGLWGTGLEGLVQSSDDGADDSAAGGFESTVQEIVLVNDATVLAGEIDTEEIDAELTAASDDVFAAENEYERTGEIGDFDRYEPVEGDAGPDVLAVGEEAILFASDDDGDAAEIVRGPIEAREGETAADAEADVEWLLEEAGHGQLVVGGYAADLDEPVDDEAGEADAAFDRLEDATGICSSLELEDDGATGATGAFAAIGDDLPGEGDLESILGTSAAEATLEVDGDRVTASATWEADVTDESV